MCVGGWCERVSRHEFDTACALWRADSIGVCSTKLAITITTEQHLLSLYLYFTRLSGSSTILQTPECSQYHSSEQSPVCRRIETFMI